MCGLEGERQALRAELERSGVPSESVDSVLARVRAQAPDAARSEKLYVPGTRAEPFKPAPPPASTSSASAPSALPAASTASSAAAGSSMREHRSYCS